MIVAKQPRTDETQTLTGGETADVAAKAGAQNPPQNGRQLSEVDKLIGQRIRYFRTKKDLSQARLGERLGISFQQIQKYERGLNRVSCATLLQLANELGVGPLDLLPEGPHPAMSKLNSLLQDLSESVPLIEAFSNIRSPEARKAILLILQQMGVPSKK